MRVSFGNRISAQSWDRALAELALAAQASPHVDPQSIEQPLDIDLSAVGFADFVVLGRILILVAGIASVGGAVTVRLPTSAPLPQEELLLARRPSLETDGGSRQHNAVAQRRRQRTACRLFMRQAGFLSALEHGPWRDGMVKVVEDADPQMPNSIRQPREWDEPDLDLIMQPQPPLRQRRLVPYRWLDSHSSNPEWETRSLEAEMTALGLDAEDCAVLAHVVAEELIQNVRDHAVPPYGDAPCPLVGLVALYANAYSSRVDDYDASLHGMISWAAQLKSQLVRLFVGDAGRGFEPLRFGGPNSPEQYSPADIQAAIIQAMDTWTPSPTDHLPIRGLWKLDRVIQSYSGSLILISKGAAAGYVFDGSTGRTKVSTVLPYRIPGTIVECSMPTLTGRLRPLQEGELPSAVFSPAFQVPNLRPVSVTFEAGHGIEPVNLQQVQQVLAQLSPADGLVIAAELPKDRRQPRQAELAAFIRDVLDLGARAAEVAPVGIVFAGINRTLLALSVTDFNQRADTSGDRAGVRLGSTFLVVAPENLHYWVAGPPGIREVFKDLSQADDSLPVDRLARDNRLIRQIRTQPGLQLRGPLVSLRLRPQDVIRSLSEHFEAKLQVAVDNADVEGVEADTFLTPGLRFTSRWINVQKLLTALNCRSTVGFLLAVLTTDRVGPYLRSSEVSVLRAGSISRDLVTVFALSLTGSGKYYDSASNIPVQVHGQSTAPPRAVIICTDLVSTAQTARMAVREIQAYGGSVIAIATVLDAREHHSDEDPDHIQVDNLPIAVIRLAAVSISAPDEPDHFQPIDPIIGAPVSPVPVRVKPPINQDTYLSALKRTSAARIGHIVRAGGRHYTAYVDPTLLFRDNDWAASATELMVNKVKAARRVLDLVELTGCPVVILYPGRTGDNIADVAQLLANALRAASIPVENIIQVPRAVFDGKWTFPASITLPDRPLHAVLLDPVCRSGQTTRQLIRLTAIAQVHSVTSFVLLNGLSDAEALALHQTTSVEPVDPRTGRQIRNRVLPVSVTFLSRTAVARMPSERCPICRLRRSYAALPPALPKPLLNHQRILLSALEPHSKDIAFENTTPIDLLGVSIEQADCIEYLTWRARLNEAVYNTMKRKEVVDAIRPYLGGQSLDPDEPASDLTGATDSVGGGLSRECYALIRLLAAEGNWLKSAPLMFDENSTNVAQVAALLVQSPRRIELDALLRCQAAMVFAAADPLRFARDLPEIVRDSADHTQICSQVLLEVVRLLESPRTPNKVTEKLVEGLIALEDLLGDARTVPYIAPEIQLPQQVRFLSSIARRKLTGAPSNPLAAWSVLRSHHLASVRTHAYDEPVWRLLLRLRNIDGGLFPSDPHAAVNDWLVCSDSLAVQALVNLPPLAPILLSNRVTAQFSDHDAALWHQVVLGNGRALLDDISLRIQTIFSLDDDSAVSDTDKASDIAEHVEWWNRFFFSAPSDGVSQRRDAVLVRLLEQCPTSLPAVLEEAFQDSNCEINSPDMPYDNAMLVFCANDLLSNLFMHIRLNAHNTRIPGAEQDFEILINKDGPDHLRVVVKNSASDPLRSTGSGQGLTNLAADLDGFGAEFVDATAALPMTYAVGVRLRRWRTVW
jgi:orotate phosphoribosyltransferase